ncbi:phenylacetic acid degradation protein paaN [Allopseudospirillum japonicum]|uniref:Phenylacetic acid degradation protein paaN n=1 Tax=Allopseudospirillum japonicum TaxID=64971 RepID=A0A1H6T2Y9_9GAMM|nr:phenylacetic acid degradation protein PaaN [Allopseudospirillum japonicum]SEI70615.1 phenylacetic acid degradation protein paaN [Allopseudospirillum japonicum]
MSDAQALFATHQATLQQALEAIQTRDYWTPYSEMPSKRIYGENAEAEGKAAFESYLNARFELAGVPEVADVGEEASPYGIELNIRYPQPDPQALIARMQAALPAWRDAGVDARAGVCMEILQRLNQRSFEIAHAVMHTTGQAFMMAFQAGGPHAQDRGLEAVAYAYAEMKKVPENATWTKPQGKNPPLVMHKRFHIVPRGISLVIACSTFPTWNTYPGLFASLVTGNPVIVKPHPGAVLPVAISVKIAQQVLEEAGFDPALVSMAADSSQAPITKTLALDPAVKLIDFTGSTAFGDWLEENARQAQVFTEKAGVNSIVIDSVQDMKAVARNLAFTLSLYSGQMCTTTQAIYVPRTGIKTAEGSLSFDEVAQALATATSKFLADNDRACAVLGAVQSCATAERIEQCTALGEVVLASESRQHPEFANARVRTPLILKVDAQDKATYSEERFGPIAFIIATDSTEHSLNLAREVINEKGAITLGVYSTDAQVLEAAEALAIDVKVALSCNLDGGVFVNQSAAFSDFHATGGNPAANASLTDTAFVARRFVIVQSRRHA